MIRTAEPSRFRAPGHDAWHCANLLLRTSDRGRLPAPPSRATLARRSQLAAPPPPPGPFQRTARTGT
eukprot:4928479-Pyramimonas_sp.AAC.1